MALRYKVLERFSEAARRKTAERAFAQRNGRNGVYVCRDGLCVAAALLIDEGMDPGTPTPWGFDVAKTLGIAEDVPEREELKAIMVLNDSGKLRTRKAVRALLLGDVSH